MEELLAAAAQSMDAPEEMVMRSAEARAKASGASVEDVLREWSGGEPAPAPASAPTPAEVAPAVEATPAAPPAPKVAAAPPTPEEAIGEDAVVALAAHVKKLPESMIRRSAKARADVAETTYEAVLAEWAGVPVEQVTAEPPAPSAPAAAPAAESPAAAPAPAAADPVPAAMDDAALLAAAAEKMGMPESMVKRSAGARAKAQNQTVEAVLAEWAGVDAPAAAAAAPASAPAAASAEAPAASEAPSVPSGGPEVEILGSGAEAPDEPTGTSSDDDSLEPAEAAVAAGALPRWLAALFVFIPAFAIAYALFLPNGPNCGDAGSLAVDPVTGIAVNCDFSDFGAEVADYFAIGSETYAGIGCVACHGAGGAGVASFPGFTEGALLTTFPEGQCDAQIEWIALGTAGWPDPTYGANALPVGGSGAVMPGFEGTLDAEEIASVALYERVAFGGQALDAALVDCGFSTGETVAAGE